MSNSNANEVGMSVRDDLIKQLKEHHSKTLQSLLTKEQLEILFGEALANPDEAQFPLGEVEIVEAVQRFLKERDELVDEVECRKSHTDTEYGELKEEIEELKHREYCLRQDAKGYSPSEVQEYRDEIEVLQESFKIVKDENEVNKKNLYLALSEKKELEDKVAMYDDWVKDLKYARVPKLEKELESKDETIAYGRGVISGVIDRLTDATELLNTLGYTFDENTETWEEEEKVEDKVEDKVEERRVQEADDEDSEPVGAWRIYCGCDAWKCDLPCQEEFFETLTEARARIDEINKGRNPSPIKLSYDTIDYEWYSESWVKKEEDTDEQ